MRAIDGDALIKALVRKEPFSDCARVVIAECMEEVRHAPTIEPERKRGKWIKEDQYINRWGDTVEILRCPICEFKHNYTQGDTSHSDDGWFDFCPYCGSDMREGDQDGKNT